MIEKYPSPIEKWQANFEQQPLEALDHLLTGYAYMGRLSRNDTDEILFRLFHTATEDRLIALDGAMQSWFMRYLEVAPPSVEAVRWIEILQNAFSIVIRLDLREAQEWLQENYISARLWLRSLYLDPAGDPEADLLRTLTLCQRSSDLLPLWMRLCRLEEDRPWHFASIGLLGLCKLPKENGDLHPAVFSGIVDLANAVSRQARTKKEGQTFWLLEVRALMARYPRSSKYWAKYFLPLVMFEPTSTAAEWLGKLIPWIGQELKRHQRRFTSTRYAQLVSPVEYTAILDLLATQPLERIRPTLIGFLDRCRIYARQTGYAEDLVKKLSAVGYKTYTQDVNWALALIEEAFHWAPYDPYLWTQRATLESYLHRNARAIGILWEAKRTFPENTHIRTILARLVAKEGKTDIAEMVYRQAIEDFPNDPHCRSGLAEVLKTRGRLKEAEEVYRQAAKHFPNDPYFRSGLAEVLKTRGRLKEAEEVYRRAVKHFRENVVCHAGLAEVLRMRGRLDEAERMYRQAIEHFPDNPYCRSGLAEVLKEQGKLAQEERDLPRVQKKLAEAGAVYRQAMKDFPDDPVSYVGLAIILLRQGKQKDAISLLEETVEQFPQNLIVEGFLQQVKGGKEDPDAIEVSYEQFSAAMAEMGRAALFGKIPIEKEAEIPYKELSTEMGRAALFGKIPIEKEAEIPYEELSTEMAEAERIRLASEAFIETEAEPITTSFLPSGGDASETQIGLANLYRLAARRAMGEGEVRYWQESMGACEKALSQNPNNIFALLEKGFGLLDQEPRAAATFFDDQVANRKRSNVLGFRIGNLRAKMQGGEAVTPMQWKELVNEFRSRKTIITLERARQELHHRNGTTLSMLESLRKQLRTDSKTLPKSLWENENWMRSVVEQRLFAKIDLVHSLTEDSLPQLHDNYEQNNLILQGVIEQSLTAAFEC